MCETEAEKERVLVTGIQPSGSLTIAHLIGTLRGSVALQESCDCLFFVADLHAITVPQVPSELRSRSTDLFCAYLACGIDPEESILFVQSHVPAHAELAAILGCYASMGELGRMTQYKDKAKKQNQGIRAGLFFYPVLMAADILLYGADLVPVGEDQNQHLELARNLAQRFNSLHGETFVVPEAYLPPVGGRVRSLADPLRKMSKSDENPRSYIELFDPPEVIRSKIRRAVTDSGRDVRYEPEKAPAISNLLTIRSALTNEPISELENRYAGMGYKEFKSDLADVVAESLQPIQERYREIRENKKAIEALMATGAARAERRARHVIEKVKRRVGLIGRGRTRSSPSFSLPP